MKNLFRFFISIFTDISCISCNKKSSPPFYYFCNECSKNVILTAPLDKCEKCHDTWYKDGVCPNCHSTNIYWDHIDTLFYYQDKSLQRLYFLYKFQNSALAERDLTLLIKKHININPDYEIVIIPCSKKTKQRLGFNPVTKIIQNLQYPYHEILEKKVFSKTFKFLKGQERKDQKDFLQLKKKLTLDLRNKKVLLIDDILTTGSTLNHSSLIIKKFGASSVSVLSFFRN